MSTDTTLKSFQADVIDASMEVPVLVDFWASWCGPCKALTPLLEKLEKAYSGRFKLVKVDTEAEPQLAQHFRIRSIPTVYAFVRGQPVDTFQGALPEGQLREFIDRLMPNPADIEFEEATAALQRGDAAAAIQHARKAIGLEPKHDPARLMVAQLLMADGDPVAAQGMLEVLGAETRADPQVAGLIRDIEAAVEAARPASPIALLERVEANPGDLAGRMELAEYWIGHKAWEQAFEQLLEVVLRDRSFGDDLGRKRMVEVFALAENQPQLVAQWRRRLGAGLNVR